jgi:hypothetical protein
MATETLEQRVLKLEDTVQKVQEQLAQQPATTKRGWRWFVGIYADSPDFDEVVKQVKSGATQTALKKIRTLRKPRSVRPHLPRVPKSHRGLG